MQFLPFLLIIDFVEFSFAVFSLFDKAAVAVDVNVEIFVEFYDFSQGAGLLFQGTFRDGEVVVDVYVVVFLVGTFVFLEALDDVRIFHDFIAKFFHVEIVSVLEKFY